MIDEDSFKMHDAHNGGVPSRRACLFAFDIKAHVYFYNLPLINSVTV